MDLTLLIIAISISIIMIIFGTISAFYGRVSKAKKQKIIFALVLILCFNVGFKVLGFANVAILTFISSIIAFFVSGKDIKYYFMLTAGYLGAITAFFIYPFPVGYTFFGIDIIKLAVSISIGITTYGMAKIWYAWWIIFLTTITGANLFSTGILGIYFIAQSKQGIFILNIMYAYFIPIIGSLMQETSWLEDFLNFILFFLISILGFLWQAKIYKKENTLSK